MNRKTNVVISARKMRGFEDLGGWLLVFEKGRKKGFRAGHVVDAHTAIVSFIGCVQSNERARRTRQKTNLVRLLGPGGIIAAETPGRRPLIDPQFVAAVRRGVKRGIAALLRKPTRKRAKKPVDSGMLRPGKNFNHARPGVKNGRVVVRPN